MRSAPKHCCCCALPRTQPRCCGNSAESSCESSVFWRTTAPSFTITLFTQRPPQLCQQAAGTHVPPSSGFTAGAASPSFFFTSADGAQPNEESAAADAATARLPFMNWRRLHVVVDAPTSCVSMHSPLIFVSRRLVAPPPPSSTSPTDARVHSIPPILGASYSTARGTPDARALTPPGVRPPAARACSRLPGDTPRARRFAGSAVWTGRPRSCS